MPEKYIRQANKNDSAEILAIYSKYIENTTISFELKVPSLEDFTKRVETISSSYPYLVYVENDKIKGYAYASKHKEREAYDYDVEVSIYLDQNCLSSGIGTELYSVLFDILPKQGFFNAYSGITVPNEKSENIHKKFGFSNIGIYEKTGYKFGKWLDVKWLHKKLKSHEEKPEKIKKIGELYQGENYIYKQL
ncbi:MAG: N-acetyltransferase family protein [Clostridia bacterium]